MLYLNKHDKKFLEQFVKKDLNVTLRQMFNEMYKVLKEDAENIDLSGLQNRCNWILSKIVEDKNIIIQYAETDVFKNMFKNVVINQGDDKITLAINNIEVTGNSRFLAIVVILYAFALYTNLKTLGDNFDKIGGTLIEKFSEILSLEFGKRCDLSGFSLNGDVFRSLANMIHSVSPLVNIFVTCLGMLLIKRDFDKTVQTNLLLLSRAVKTQASNSAGYLYTFLLKSGEFLNIDLEFLTKDIYYQLKVIIPK